MTRRRRQTERRDQEGYILVGVCILALAMFIVAAAFLNLGGGETKASQQYLDSQRAFWLAEGGKERAIAYLSQLSRPPDADLVIYQDAAGPFGGSYTVECLVDTSALYQEQKAFMLDCTGNSRGIERRIRQRIRMTSFAQYAYFTDDELTPGGNPIWFFTPDVIEGRLHSNGTLRIAGSPQFLGPVTSASDHMPAYPSTWVTEPDDWPVGSNNPYFAQGFELNHPYIALPTQTADLRQAAQDGGVYIAPEAELELGDRGTTFSIPAPGWLRYRNLPPPNNDWVPVLISTLPSRVFYCNNNLHVKGLLDGELTVASHRNVRIEDNITHAASDAQGTPFPGCNDLLGIVAEDNVIFVNNAANQNDLIVDGVLMALNTSITAENYNQGAPRGILTIWGGLMRVRFRSCELS